MKKKIIKPPADAEKCKCGSQVFYVVSTGGGGWCSIEHICAKCGECLDYHECGDDN